jgi:hypothetical protein
MALLLIIFTGLLVLRRRGGGTFGLTRILLKQVRQLSLKRAVIHFNLLIFFFLSQGGHLARHCLRC